MTEDTATRQQLAREYVERTHMQDWTQNERRQELAAQLELRDHWQSRAAYLEARGVAGMDDGTPVHLRPSSCYVCGSAEAHADTTATGGHRYWPNSEAKAELDAEARRHTPRGYSREAAYVAQHRPY